MEVPSYTAFSEANENDPCQVVYFEEKMFQAVFEVLIVFFYGSK